MCNAAQKFGRVPLFLQGIGGERRSLYLHLFCVQLEGLAHFGREHYRAAHAQSRANAAVNYVIVIRKLFAVEHHLAVFLTGAVVEFDETEIFAVAHRTRPAAEFHLRPAEALTTGV